MADMHQIGRGQTEASIDQVNIWMRSTPWYQQQMKAWGQDPGHPTLSKDQSQQILRMAQANGVQVDEGNDEIDNHGNFNPKGHKLRNTLIVAGIAGATIATMGAAGMFAGAGATGMAGGAAGGAASGAASAGATAAGAGVSTAGIGTGGLVGSGLSATSLGLGTTAGLGTAGATGAAAVGGAAAGGAGAAGAAGAWDAAGNFIGPSTYGGGGGSGAASSIMGRLKGADYTGLADTVGGMAKAGAADNRERDRNQIYQEGNRLARDKYALEAPGTRLNQSTKASILSNFQPTKVDWGEGGFHPGAGAAGIMPRVTGGFGGGMANLDPRTKTLASQIMDDTLAGQKAGGYTGGGDQHMDPLGKQSITDRVTGGTASGLSILAALKKSGLF